MTTEVGPAPESDRILAEKAAWAANMRKMFSPEGMCNEDGSINQDFFKPKKIIIQLTEDKKWGQPERDALYKVRTCTIIPPNTPHLVAFVSPSFLHTHV